MSLIVELCGLPGAGKSSLAREISASATEGDIDLRLPTEAIGPDVPRVRRIARKLRLVTGGTLRHPVPSTDMLRRIVGSQQGGVGPISSRWVQWEATQRLMAVARSTTGVHLFDEGVTQALWSLGLRGDPSSTLAALRRTAGHWEHPDRVVVLDLPVEVVDRRLSERGSRHSRLQDVADDATRRAELARGKELLDRLVDWWAEVLPSDVSITRLGEDAGSGLLDTMVDLVHPT